MNCKCKRCNGTGKIPTYAKANKFMGMDMSGPKWEMCKKCYGTGRK